MKEILKIKTREIQQVDGKDQIDKVSKFQEDRTRGGGVQAWELAKILLCRGKCGDIQRNKAKITFGMKFRPENTNFGTKTSKNYTGAAQFSPTKTESRF